MSAETKIKTGIIGWDATFPIVIPFLLLSLVLYTGGHSGAFGHIGEEYAHLIHNHTVHYILLLGGLWFFFLRLGAEIDVGEVVAAGPLVIGAVLGGVFVPLFLTTGLVWAFGGVSLAIALYASAGAMATDVPMALGSARAMKRIATTVMVTALMILAIGDDLIGVVVMTGLFADGLDQFKVLLIEAVVLLILWFVGQDGVMEVRKWKGNEEPQKTFSDFTIVHPVFWIAVAVLNTIFLGLNGIEPILGGCLPMIFAPTAVKHLVAERTEAPALWLLLPFAIVAGAVDLSSSSSWGILTLIAFTGGFGGKILGIFVGGYLGRRGSELGSEYDTTNFDNRSLMGMSVAGACNGTVAIIFVSVAQSKGFIPYDLGNQMKIGFLLTVPASYALNLALARMWEPKVHVTQ